MIYDYRQYVADRNLRKKIDDAMNYTIGDLRTKYNYIKMEEIYQGSEDKLLVLLDNVRTDDVVYVYNQNSLGHDSETINKNVNFIQGLGARIIECNLNDRQDTATITTEPLQNESPNIDSINYNECVNYIKTTKGYYWLTMKVKSGMPTHVMLSGFNKLNELNPRQYSIDGTNKLTMDILMKCIDEIKKKLTFQSPNQPTETYKKEFSNGNNHLVNNQHEAITPTINIIDREWIERSFSFHWLYEQFEIGTDDKNIIECFNKNQKEAPERFNTHDGAILEDHRLMLYRKIYVKIKEKETKMLMRNKNRITFFHTIEEQLSKVIKDIGFTQEQHLFIDYPNSTIIIKDNKNDSYR